MKTYKQLIGELLDAGFVEQNVGGGRHRKFVHPVTKRMITVPFSPRSDVALKYVDSRARKAIAASRSS